MNRGRLLLAFVVLALISAGCNSFPGLRVLTGEDPTGAAAAEQLVQTADLVMADKSGMGDPSLMAAADRIEAASNYLADIIEIRRDEEADSFVINVIMPPPTFNPADAQAQFAYFDALRRVIELSWQGALHESEGADTLQVNVLYTQQVPTLDIGQGFVGFYLWKSEINREDAVVYLSNRPHSLDDFVNLLVEGTMTLDNTQSLYTGQPNHPIFFQQDMVPQ